MNKTLKTTGLYNDLVRSGAFVGDHYKWTHHSQKTFLYGYKNKYSFYNIEFNIILLAKATRFLKQASKAKNINIVFVGNPKGGAKGSINLFKKFNKSYFPTRGWKPGFISKEDSKLNTILVIYDIAKNRDALSEAVRSGVPVVGFLTPNCPVYGVDYPIFLNLQKNTLWFAHYCLALFKKKRPSKIRLDVLQNTIKTKR
jgi:ribosomal protein S2